MAKIYKKIYAYLYLIILGCFSQSIQSQESISQDYIVVCEAGRWEGNFLATEANQEQIDIGENGTSLDRNVFEFSLPAKFGDEVNITYGSENYTGSITYSFTGNAFSQGQSYIVFISQPTEILDINTIQIPSGWVHLTNYKQLGPALDNQSYAKKCELTEK